MIRYNDPPDNPESGDVDTGWDSTYGEDTGSGDYGNDQEGTQDD